LVQGLSLPGRELENSAAGGGESGVSCWGVVSPRGVHRDQPRDAEPGSRALYNKRGTAEQWIKEGKQAVKLTRLSCHRFRSNQVRLALSLLPYNLGNLWRRLALPQRIENWSLTSSQQRLVKTGGRLVKHARNYWLLLAEGHLTRRRFGAMLGRIAQLPVPTG
jgi:Transposase DDE domain group 1